MYSSFRFVFPVIAAIAVGCGGSLDDSPTNPFGTGKGEGATQLIPIATTAWVIEVGFVQVAEKDDWTKPIAYDPQNADAPPTLQLRVMINGMEGNLTTPPGYDASFSQTHGILLSGVPGAGLLSQWQFELAAQQASGQPWVITNCSTTLSESEKRELETTGSAFLRRTPVECGMPSEAELRQLKRIEFQIYQDPTQPTLPPATLPPTTQPPAQLPATQPPATTQPGQPPATTQPGQPPATTQPGQPPATTQPQAPAWPAPASSEAVGCGIAKMPTTSPFILLLLLISLSFRRRR